MIGKHLLAHWARTQQCIALSSCEAELNGIVKASSEGLSARHICEELGMTVALKVRTDSSAARGVCQREGAGKIKHLAVKQLWTQEKETQGELEVLKVPRESNWADLMTHHWSRAEGEKHLKGLGVIRREAEGAQRGAA